MKNINKTIKLVTFVTIAIMLIMIVSNVFAATSPDDFKNQKVSTVDTNGIVQWGGTIIDIVSTVGSAAAVVILIILGIKYMMGSTEDKAEYKKSLLPYILGAVFVFGASILTKVIYDFIN